MSMDSGTQVFNRQIKQLHRINALRIQQSSDIDYTYLHSYIGNQLLDRLAILQRKFTNTLEIGANNGVLFKLLQQRDINDLHGIDQLVLTDNSIPHINYLHKYINNTDNIVHKHIKTHLVASDEEWISARSNSMSLVLSNMTLHWCNDLSSILQQIRSVLVPDGVFLCSMLGGATLQELRSAFACADIERNGGVAPHISPFVAGRDCGDLLQSNGYSMPTVDTEQITIRYPDMFTLCEHLKSMGETNAINNMLSSVSRDTFLSAASIYHSMYADSDGLIPATFQVYYLIGWSPDSTQPKPKRRGSQQGSFDDGLSEVQKQSFKPLNTNDTNNHTQIK